MGFDARQVLGAVLTFTMFAMLANMIRRDHFDSFQVIVPGPPAVHFDVMKVEEKGISMLPMGKGPWKGNGQELKSCWAEPRSKEVDQPDQPKGFITFSLSNGPEYHILEIADAVVITRYLGATLVLPDIRGRTPSEKRKFEEIYDVEKFMKSLDGVINIAREKPAEIAAKKLAVVRVPSRVSEDYIAENIEPIFRINGNLKLATYFPSVNMKIEETQKDADSVSCMAMFSALELQPEIHEVVDSMVRRLRTLSRKLDGQFVAVDLRVEMLQRKRCKESGGAGRKSCYNAEEVGEFLRKIGFDEDTTIYVTQSRWDESLHVLKNVFPKTYTKAGIMPADKKDKFLNSGYPEFEKAIDFYICSQSDVFVPAISGMFYANVAGKRISSGKTQILVPATIPGPSAPAADFISSYVSKKSHLAYSCFC